MVLREIRLLSTLPIIIDSGVSFEKKFQTKNYNQNKQGKNPLRKQTLKIKQVNT